ncbi:MAG: cryptochrome/photolyase family protein [Planctomycetota bacterium]|nr:cryptochrome/photolyase family protein [Planctomycetota bacterium]
MSIKTTALVYPHQLFAKHPAVSAADTVVLVEDPLFFKQFQFHAQKLVLHRASMSEFAEQCKQLGKKVHRIESKSIAHSGEIGPILKAMKIKTACVVDPTDQWLTQRVAKGCRDANIDLTWLEDTSFLTPTDVMQRWAENRKHYHFTDFYMQQRKRLQLLLDDKGKPLGGKWTFDTENRKRLPKGTSVPELPKPTQRPSVAEAIRYVAKEFPNAPGELSEFFYPVTHVDAASWLEVFIDQRLCDFGDFEDAISKQEAFLFHGVLTPMLNIGLLTPEQIIERVLAKSEQVSLNSLEGFIRQVIGWREFIRVVYIHAGSKQRTQNAWNLTRSLPSSFYSGTTGIVPFDQSVKRTLKYAYCHHIERLMVLGNFMLLCDISPDSVYQWFMELFIDSYDWVMVPNVYGMSQHADGGLMTTKPYISGSSYILKMSDYPKGDWCEIWDALYWRFIDREREFFSSNPRMRVMVGQLDRMGKKLDHHREVSERFLEKLHG